MTTPVSVQDTPFELAREPGVRLRGVFRDVGDPVGVFLHGFRSTSGGLKGLALATHAAASGRSWLRVDLRGHGRSDGAFAALRITTLIEDVAALLDLLAPRPVVLVGSSLGGWLSTLMALQRPEQIRGLLLIAPAFNFIQQYFGRLPPALLAQWQQAGRRSFVDPYDGASYMLDYELLLDADRYDVWHLLAPLPGPVVVVHGTADAAVPFAQSQDFIRRLDAPLARLMAVEGGDHRLAGGLETILQGFDLVWQRVTEGPR